MKRLLCVTCCLPCAVFISSVAFAETVSFSIHPPREKIVLGTPFMLELESLHPEGFSLKLDTAAQTSDSFAILGISRRPLEKKTSKDQPLISEKFTMEVMPFDVGTATFPSLSWIMTPLRGTAGGKKIFSPSLPIKIAGVVSPTGGKGDIKDIRPPINPFPWIAMIAVILLLAAVIALLIRLTGRKQPWKSPQTAGDNRPADAAALKELDRLVSSQLWENGRFKEFYNRLSDILKLYIFRRMEIPAMFMTTSDLCRQLRRNGQEIEITSSARECLESCDMVKFAKSKPSAGGKDSDCDIVRRIIDKTSPVQADKQGSDLLGRLRTVPQGKSGVNMKI